MLKPERLRRDIGLPGAVIIGLGSILGTGVFVSIAIAAEIAGPAILLAVILAGALASFNGFSSAALATAHPVSGGAYEYGYTFVTPAVGFTAGWMFLIAKGASAATAALGFAGYLWSAIGAGAAGNAAGAAGTAAGAAGTATGAAGNTAGAAGDAGANGGLSALAASAAEGTAVPVITAVLLVLLLTVLVAAGVRRSNRVNGAIVGVTVASLLFFVVSGFSSAVETAPAAFESFMPSGGISALLHATALAFVAFTGYGRVATLGEEVKNPGKTVPRAVVATLIVTVLIYALVAFTGFAAIPQADIPPTDGAFAPLALRAEAFAGPVGLAVLTVGAIAAMAGVLLNLILGLSRVVLAMGRRSDLPGFFAALDRKGQTPIRAVWLVGAGVAALALIGDVRTTWSFSAFTVLVYYAITNLAALRIPRARRIIPRWVSACGLVGCLIPAFFVEPFVWLSGLALIAAGLAWHTLARRGAG